MVWVQLDDRFDDHPSHLKYDADVLGLIVCALTFSCRNLTDGRVPTWWLRRRFPRHGIYLARRLVRDGKWVEIPSEDPTCKVPDFLIRDFLDYNPSKEEVLSRRSKLSEERAEAGRRGGMSSAESRRSKRANGEANGEANGQAKPKANTQAKRSPLRSDPIRSFKKEEKESFASTPEGRSEPGAEPCDRELAVTPAEVESNGYVTPEQHLANLRQLEANLAVAMKYQAGELTPDEIAELRANAGERR